MRRKYVQAEFDQVERRLSLFNASKRKLETSFNAIFLAERLLTVQNIFYSTKLVAALALIFSKTFRKLKLKFAIENQSAPVKSQIGIFKANVLLSFTNPVQLRLCV